jgi:dTMP kinase
MGKKIIVSFEGIDGCGKTTQAKLLYEHLVKRGMAAVFLNEPGGTAVGERIRTLLLDREEKPCMWSELFLYLASRAQLLSEVILREAEKGSIIILDRYIDSTTAYQGYGRGLPVDLIGSMHKAFLNGMFPDLTFLIDAPAEVLIPVLEGKEKDRIEGESVEFQKKVRAGYLKIAGKEKGRFAVIERKGIEETCSAILKTWEAFINGRK